MGGCVPNLGGSLIALKWVTSVMVLCSLL